MFRRLSPHLALPLVLFCAGCTGTHSEISTVARSAKVLSPPIRAVQKWNPVWSFGNADDPEPPEWYRPDSPSRRWLWQMRNPLHNFTFYVVGVSDRPTTRTGRFPADVFAPTGGWNWAFARHRWLPLPFISFNGKLCRFYLGWRESGNLGAKFNFTRATKKPGDQGSSTGGPSRTSSATTAKM